jgi:hypothetical protein
VYNQPMPATEAVKVYLVQHDNHVLLVASDQLRGSAQETMGVFPLTEDLQTFLHTYAEENGNSPVVAATLARDIEAQGHPLEHSVHQFAATVLAISKINAEMNILVNPLLLSWEEAKLLESNH